jgi:hypothetical protein
MATRRMEESRLKDEVAMLRLKITTLEKVTGNLMRRLDKANILVSALGDVEGHILELQRMRPPQPKLVELQRIIDAAHSQYNAAEAPTVVVAKKLPAVRRVRGARFGK